MAQLLYSKFSWLFFFLFTSLFYDEVFASDFQTKFVLQIEMDAPGHQGVFITLDKDGNAKNHTRQSPIQQK